MDTPKLTIRVRDGLTIFTQVTLDGKQLPVTRVAFDTGDDINGLVSVSMTFLADLDVEVEGTPLDWRAIREGERAGTVEVDFGTLTEPMSTARPKVTVA